MLNDRERRLLALLAATVAAAVLAVALGLGMERLRAARDQAEKLRAVISKLEAALPSGEEEASRVDGLEADLAAAKSRFYAPVEMSPYAFGTLVKNTLVSLGMTVIRYQVVDFEGRKDLEFSVSGPVRSLVLFLEGVSEAEKLSSIPSLAMTVREGTDVVDAVFRIGYETLD
jgi:hypothetical protein